MSQQTSELLELKRKNQELEQECERLVGLVKQMREAARSIPQYPSFTCPSDPVANECVRVRERLNHILTGGF